MGTFRPTGLTASRSCRASGHVIPRTSISPGGYDASTRPHRHRRGHGNVVGPATAMEIGRANGDGVLDLEGRWTRLRGSRLGVRRCRVRSRTGESHGRDAGAVRRGDQAQLMGVRMQEIKDAGVDVLRLRQPAAHHHVRRRHPGRRGFDLLVIQGTISSVAGHRVEDGRRAPGPGEVTRAELEIPIIVEQYTWSQAALAADAHRAAVARPGGMRSRPGLHDPAPCSNWGCTMPPAAPTPPAGACAPIRRDRACSST